MPGTTVHRPVVRSFKQRFTREAAAWVRSGGHAFLWESDKRVHFVFPEPAKGDEGDLGAWGVYDMGKWRWSIHTSGPLKGLASMLVPKDCIWIAKRRTERDSVHKGPKRKVVLDCTTCAACCKDNEVLLQEVDIERFVRGGRADLTKKPYVKRHADGRVLLTLLPDKRCRHLGDDNRCGIYAVRPDACSEFPAGSECCLYAREDGLQVYDGVAPGG